MCNIWTNLFAVVILTHLLQYLIIFSQDTKIKFHGFFQSQFSMTFEGFCQIVWLFPVSRIWPRIIPPIGHVSRKCVQKYDFLSCSHLCEFHDFCILPWNTIKTLKRGQSIFPPILCFLCAYVLLVLRREIFQLTRENNAYKIIRGISSSSFLHNFLHYLLEVFGMYLALRVHVVIQLYIITYQTIATSFLCLCFNKVYQ